MTRILTACLTIAAFATAAGAAEKQYQLKDLPAAVQKTVQDQTKGAEIKGITKEKEHGMEQYEIETMVNGKHRDFDVDTKGNLLVVEEETAIDSFPAAARAAIEKKVGAGKLVMAEKVTKGAVTLYEATYTTKSGKKTEVMVKADGTPTKD